jgi:hypothetical protein
MKPIRAKKPKPTKREQGFVTRAEAADWLRRVADDIENSPQKELRPLVRVHVSCDFAKDDALTVAATEAGR